MDLLSFHAKGTMDFVSSSARTDFIVIDESIIQASEG